ncbi:MAG: type II secretion system F family protein [Chloroflexota bacterium]|nr:type II secretion system F family protein [Chloroflexota bacterium]
MTFGPILVSLLVALSVLMGFMALWRMFGAANPVEERLTEYSGTLDTGAEGYLGQRSRLPALNRTLAGFGFGPRLAGSLTRADISMTAAEYFLIIFGAALAGLLIGLWRGGVLLALVLAALGGFLPLFYLRVRENRRRRAFTEQIPDILTLMVGALRAGYGLTQAMGLLVDEMAEPASKEFSRVMQAITLGVPMQRALSDMAERVGSVDWDMVVTAINVQYETGGNLAQTLDTISYTVRDRIRLLRDVQVMTAQQRFTGYVLAALPFIVGLAMFLIVPMYISRLFEPGWIRLLPVAALILQLIGFLIIRRIVDIDV